MTRYLCYTSAWQIFHTCFQVSYSHLHFWIAQKKPIYILVRYILRQGIIPLIVFLTMLCRLSGLHSNAGSVYISPVNVHRLRMSTLENTFMKAELVGNLLEDSQSLIPKVSGQGQLIFDMNS